MYCPNILIYCSAYVPTNLTCTSSALRSRIIQFRDRTTLPSCMKQRSRCCSTCDGVSHLKTAAKINKDFADSGISGDILIWIDMPKELYVVEIECGAPNPECDRVKNLHEDHMCRNMSLLISH